MTTINSNTTLSIALPYIHSIIIPLIIFGVFSNPLLAAFYLSIPAVVYTTVKKEREIDFFLPAILIAALLVAGWADALPMP